MARFGDVRGRIAELTSSAGTECLTTFSLEGFERRWPYDWKTRWDQKCGAIESMLDMECGFVDFFRMLDAGKRPSIFEVIGFLQALAVQQDAVTLFARAVDIPIDTRRYSDLKDIREIRVRAAGHPAYANRVQPPGSGMWTPSTISSEGFEMVYYFADRSSKRRHSFRDLFDRNERALEALLEHIEQEMIRADAEIKPVQSGR